MRLTLNTPQATLLELEREDLVLIVHSLEDHQAPYNRARRLELARLIRRVVLDIIPPTRKSSV